VKAGLQGTVRKEPPFAMRSGLIELEEGQGPRGVKLIVGVVRSSKKLHQEVIAADAGKGARTPPTRDYESRKSSQSDLHGMLYGEAVRHKDTLLSGTVRDPKHNRYTNK